MLPRLSFDPTELETLPPSLQHSLDRFPGRSVIVNLKHDFPSVVRTLDEQKRYSSVRSVLVTDERLPSSVSTSSNDQSDTMLAGLSP